MTCIYSREATIQNELVAYLTARGWLVERLVGNAFQVGIPDLFCFHRTWGFRWIDVKVEGRYSFTKAQKLKWPFWEAFGCGIWILTGADEANYKRLFGPPNWRDYDRWNCQVPCLADIDRLLDEIED